MDEPNIVVSRTPLRVSLLGGGSDMPEYFENNGPGQVISLAIDKYIYVVVKKHAPIFGEQFRLSYSKNEIVDSVENIENNIIRECLRFLKFDARLYISTFSDIPAASGLGTSSALAVGLLNALHAMKSEPVTRSQLAEEACKVELEILQKPIGKQDQYAAAFGGLNKFSFQSNGNVTAQSLNLSGQYLSELLSSASLFWTGLTREVSDILTEQKNNFAAGKLNEVSKVTAMVPGLATALEAETPIKEIAELISESWELKRKFASSITSNEINRLIKQLRNAGGWGGKLCGGGGGGFVLMFHDPTQADYILSKSNTNFRLKLGMDYSGSEILQVN